MGNLFKSGILLLSIVSILGCSDPTVKRQQAEEKIAEAVLRKEIADWYGPIEASLAHPKDKDDVDVARSLDFQTIYLSVQDRDPSDEFLSRFQDLGKTIKKSSASAGHTGRDKNSGKQGILFITGPVKWLTRDSVEVYGQYWCGGLCSAEYLHVVRLNDGRWTVETTKLIWIS